MKKIDKDKPVLSKEYKPKSKLYLIVGVISFIIRISPYSIGYKEINIIINDLAVGIIGSVFFAWLIDWVDCSNRNKEMIEKERKILSEYDSSITNLKIFVARRSVFLCNNSSQKRTFKQWLFIYTDIDNYKGVEQPEQRLKENYDSLSRQIKFVFDALSILKQQYALLVNTDMIDTDDFKQHIDYQYNLCIDIIDFINNKDYSNAKDILIDMVENHHNYFNIDPSEEYSFKGIG